MTLKKRLMELMWRLQQSQAIIGLLMWSLMLTGIFYPYLRDKFKIDPANVLVPMLILFLLILFVILLIGLAFDKLRFWKEQNIVVAERNPYATYKLYPKEIYWAHLWLSIARAQPSPTPELRRQIEFFEGWLERLISEDPSYRREVEEIEAFVRAGAERVRGADH
ncbi:MAG: hypothetical protein ACUVV6_03035 [Thermoplasmatota archaeon]